ncbi:hypothetical protein D779_1411 [Imhoffiella purpurea]|uniref:Uncharacterized protein n=1 Tax=Imhoffiella purpurea TaxID=1249627 RepID=W9VHC6_9GAMM|nr:hypothetical protein D779_1411 [Imhoffiella purpurea]
MELFHRIATDQGAAILVVTHDTRTLDLSDRVLELADGRPIASSQDEAMR